MVYSDTLSISVVDPKLKTLIPSFWSLITESSVQAMRMQVNQKRPELARMNQEPPPPDKPTTEE